LARSAPLLGYRLPDYHGLADGLQKAVLFHVIEALHLTAIYWNCAGILEKETSQKGGEARVRRKRTLEIEQMAARQLTAQIDGWTQFCAELNIDPDVLLRDTPWYGIVKDAEPAARAMACTPEETAAWMGSKGKEPVDVITPEKVAASFREFLDMRRAWWD
jgi:hypothetical protein